MPITLGILAQSLAAPVAAGSFDLLETVLLTTNTASVTFSNLNNFASTYRHLQVRVVSRDTRGVTTNNLFYRLNGDTGSNYAGHFLYGTGSSVISEGVTSTNNTFIGVQGSNNNPANVFGATVIDILDPFVTTKNTTLRAFTGVGGSQVGLFSGLWMNTAAVTSINLLPAIAGDFVSGSRFSLYGVR